MHFDVEKGRERDPITKLGAEVGALCEKHGETNPLSNGWFFMAGDENGFSAAGQVSPRQLARLIKETAEHSELMRSALACVIADIVRQ